MDQESAQDAMREAAERFDREGQWQAAADARNGVGSIETRLSALERKVDLILAELRRLSQEGADHA